MSVSHTPNKIGEIFRSLYKRQQETSKMATYIYETDLLNFDVQVIAQQCNCVGKSLKGLSEQIASRYPFANFYDRESQSVPGTIEIRGVKRQNPFVIAMFAQRLPGKARPNDSSSQRISWFQECLDRIAKIKGLRSIAFPCNIGCGLAGGDWNTYSEMIERWAVKNKESFQIFIVSRSPLCKEISYKTMSLLEFTKSFLSRSAPSNKAPSEGDLSRSAPANKAPSEGDLSRSAPSNWKEFFEMAIEDRVIGEISASLEQEKRKYEIYPPLNLVYSIFELCSPKDVRVIILGQDPYKNEGEAMGISFSVAKGVPIPSSLRNIFTEMRNDGFRSGLNGDLTPWARQGVLLINTALTLRKGEAMSHTKVWEVFTEQLIRYINANCSGVVIMWGAPAQRFSNKFDDKKFKKIASSHPCGMSANSPCGSSPPFFGSKPFSKANKYLLSMGKEEIHWNLM